MLTYCRVLADVVEGQVVASAQVGQTRLPLAARKQLALSACKGWPLALWAMVEGDVARDCRRVLREQDGADEEKFQAPQLQSAFTIPTTCGMLNPDTSCPSDIAQIDFPLEPASGRSSVATATRLSQADALAPVVSLGRGSSNFATGLLILKSTVGGTLVLIPGAFKDAGFVPACALLVVIGGIEIYCMTLLVKCNRAIGGGSYGDVVRHSLGAAGCWAVDISLVLSQLGFVCTEMLYVAKNGHTALAQVGGPFALSEEAILQLQLLVTLPMSWIPHLKHFTSFACIANAVVLAALGTLLATSLTGVTAEGAGPELRLFGPGSLLFAGIVVFSFECINFVIPMYEAHEKKDTFVAILSSTLWLVVLLFITFGGINYYRYGKDTQPVLTRNLPAGSPVAKVMPFVFAFASLLNVPLFLFPASITIERKVLRPGAPSCARAWNRNLLRSSLILLCTLVAFTTARRIEALVAVVGSFCCAPLAFIFPAVSHYVLCPASPVARAADCGIAVFGVLLFVATTVEAIAAF